MKFTLCILALVVVVSVEAAPEAAAAEAAPEGITLPTNDVKYYTQKLQGIQEAIVDTLKAGQDLQIMEKNLQGIVNLSSYFWRAESATEYATSSKPYANEWKTVLKANGESCSQNSECQSGNCSLGQCWT